jgi:hypothetical protein
MGGRKYWELDGEWTEIGSTPPVELDGSTLAPKLTLGNMAPRWHQGTIATRALTKNKNIFFENASKQIIVFRSFKRSMGAWECAGTIGNCYSFAHAKYGANP